MTPADNTPVQADALVEAEQIDRNAAGDLATELGWPCASVCNISRGNCDTHTIVQAFARHRLASQPSTDAQVKPLSDAEGIRQLELLYNHKDDDSAQFTRWQMIVAMYHGMRLAHPPADKARIAALEAALRRIGNSAPNHCACCTHMGHTARAALENRHD